MTLRALTRFKWAGKRFRSDQEGASFTAEFLIVLPIILTIFLSTFEIGLLMIKSSMLDRSVDLTMRALRLGHITLPTTAKLKEEICKESTVLSDCMDNITVELQRISTTNWTMPTTAVGCINKEDNISPPLSFTIGQQNDIMLTRICVAQPALFPTTSLASGVLTIGVQLPKSAGHYGLTNVTAFVTEPD